MFSQALKSVVAKSDRETSMGWLPFWMHSFDTAGVMEKLLLHWIPRNVYDYLSESCGGEDRVLPTARFCALTHDIGKITAFFQARIAEAMLDSPFLPYMEPKYAKTKNFLYNGKTPHPLASQAILLRYGCPKGIASIAGAHHGRTTSNIDELKDHICTFHPNYYGSQELFYNFLWQEWIDFSLQDVGLDSIKALPELPMPTQMLLCGLLIIADWIASNPRYFPLISLDEKGSISDYPARIEHGWEKLAFPEPWCADVPFGMDREAFQARFGFLPNGTQEEVIEAVNEADAAGIYILEAPMGLGKTEAALAMAEVLAARTGAGGLFFGMPTQATSNGLFTRLEKWAAGLTENEGVIHSIRLAHAAAMLNDEYRELLEGYSNTEEENTTGLIVHDWLSGRKQVMLADFVMGTTDQMLMAGLKQRHVMLRHIGLAGKVVVVDECHAYDAYMSCYLDMVIRWLGTYKVPVIILSATLPTERRAELIEAYLGNVSDDRAWKHNLAYPLLTYTDGENVQQKVLSYRGEDKEIRVEKISYAQIVETVGEGLQCGGCVGVIMNTVKRAQEIATALRTEFPENRVIVIHSQFIMTERAKREKQILELVGKNSTEESRRGLIIVGTQVLEQSLDLDFDRMITELCPMDLLLQRMGRLHRHTRIRPNGLEKAKCYVVDEIGGDFEEGSKAVYGEWLLAKTRALLPDTVTIPQDIPKLVKQTYDDADVTMFTKMDTHLQDALRVHQLEVQKKKRNAKDYLLGKPKKLSKRSQKNVLDGLLDCSIQISEQHGEQAVRDGDPSIDVIALWRDKDEKVRLLVENEDDMKRLETNDIFVPTDRPPSFDESLVIARQKLKLPAIFSKQWNIDGVIHQLEKETKRYFSEWQKTSLLKEELVLLFDGQYQAEIAGKTLMYDKDNGLMFM